MLSLPFALLFPKVRLLILDALLCQMIVEPEQRVPDFIKAGADIVSVHCEQSSTIHLHRTVNQVRIFFSTCFNASYRHSVNRTTCCGLNVD